MECISTSLKLADVSLIRMVDDSSRRTISENAGPLVRVVARASGNLREDSASITAIAKDVSNLASQSKLVSYSDRLGCLAVVSVTDSEDIFTTLVSGYRLLDLISRG